MENKLYTYDNLHVLLGMDSESVDLIYLDPPFNSKRTYSAPIGSKAAGASFKDMWNWGDVDIHYLETLYRTHPSLTSYIESVQGIHSKSMMAYLTFMAQRLLEMQRVLKSTGSFYLHCDPAAGHYLKILLDKIFGKDRFRNEIVWFYNDTPGRPKRDFSRKHDVIFRYTKSKNWTFNADKIKIPILEASKIRYKYSRTLGNRSKTGGDVTGKIPEDVWKMRVAKGKERTGYPTQKPLALLERIIAASSNEGDLVLDPFCGCATTCVAAEHLGRRWTGIDIEENARDLVMDRLKNKQGTLFENFIHLKEPPLRDDLKMIVRNDIFKRKLFGDQQGKCNGCYRDMNFDIFEFDHIIPQSKNGGDYEGNLQLLCPNCNRKKGDRTMEYLLAVNTRIRDAAARVSY